MKKSLIQDILTFLICSVFFVLLPYAMYTLGRDAWHYGTCEHTTFARVLSVEYKGRKTYHDITFAYTTPDGKVHQATQKTQDGRAQEHYPVGSQVPVRYKEGHAWLEGWRVSQWWNLLMMPFVLGGWLLMAVVLGGMLVGLCGYIRRVCSGKGRAHG